MTAIAHDSAWLAALSVPQLQSELALAASRLAAAHMTEAHEGWPAICRECDASHPSDLLSIPHRDTCRTGTLARVLYALAGVIHAPDLHPTPPRKENPAEKAGSTETSGTAAREMRPRPFLVRHNALPGLYAEPWAIDETGAVHDSQGTTIAEPVGCELVEPDDARAMERIVACVNYCDGIATDYLRRGVTLPIGGAM